MSFCDAEKPLQRLWLTEWMKRYETATLVLDPLKLAYKAWCIPSSVASAYGWSNFCYYVREVISNLFKFKFTRIAVQGEAGQLGSDFVISPHGTVALAYYCHNPTDRVPVEKLSHAVRRCNT